MFHHMEYVGIDFDNDMKKISEDETTLKWWRECEPCQKPLSWNGPPPSKGGKGDWWAGTEELFHCGHPARSFVEQQESEQKKAPRRCGSVIRLRKEKYEEYKKLHANVWPDVLKRIYDSNIRNFTIYYRADVGLMFSHFEYVGSDFENDLKAIGEDPKTLEWWKVCEPCQEPLKWDGPAPSEGGKGDWWAGMEELFHCGHPAKNFS